MLGRGDRNEMRAAYLLRFKSKPEVEFEGSDHMLAVLKRTLLRGEFPTGSLARLWLSTEASSEKHSISLPTISLR